MGCFANCFGTCKPSRRRRRRHNKTRNSSLLDHLERYQSVDDFKVPRLTEEHQEEEAELEETENPTQDLSDSNDQKEDGKANLSDRKKVTFDLNVKFYENLSGEELPEEDTEEETVKEKKQGKAKAGCDPEDSSSSSLFSYPPNHRYQNCRDSDDEFDEIVSSDESDNDYYTDDDYEDAEDDHCKVESEVKTDKQPLVTQEQSSESLFSLSINSRKGNFGQDGGDKEVNSPMPNNNAPLSDSNHLTDERNCVDDVLNPVENITQWKVIKYRSKLASKSQAKENKNVMQDSSFPDKKEKETAVDTSLSTWLVGSEGTPKRSNSRNSSVSVGNSPSDRTTVSPNKFEDRPILGALTLEEIRQMSAASTPRKSPSRSPDDMPIIGSVGSYWSHTGQTTQSGASTTSTKSRYRESAEVIWNSTPFEARLEKALEKEANAEVLAP